MFDDADTTKDTVAQAEVVDPIDRLATVAEVKRLRHQARVSTGVAIGAIIVSIGTIMYASSQLQVMPWQLTQPKLSTVESSKTP